MKLQILSIKMQFPDAMNELGLKDRYLNYIVWAVILGLFEKLYYYPDFFRDRSCRNIKILCFELVIQYMKTGGLPELFHLPNNETKRHYLSAIKDIILMSDIIQRYRIRTPDPVSDNQLVAAVCS